ncbi:hypothetical protein TNCV_1833201 [Trichonephila clavipes]|nr:hypothetical protein TNCV_1833201 [Trichonephila clavipes]
MPNGTSTSHLFYLLQFCLDNKTYLIALWLLLKDKFSHQSSELVERGKQEALAFDLHDFFLNGTIMIFYDSESKLFQVITSKCLGGPPVDRDRCDDHPSSNGYEVQRSIFSGSLLSKANICAKFQVWMSIKSKTEIFLVYTSL